MNHVTTNQRKRNGRLAMSLLLLNESDLCDLEGMALAILYRKNGERIRERARATARWLSRTWETTPDGSYVARVVIGESE